MSSDLGSFVAEVAIDVTADLLTNLIKKGAGAASRAARSRIDEWLKEAQESLALRNANGRRSLAAAFAEPGDTARLFLTALHDADHARACGCCAPRLFENLERKAVLLDTLAASPPMQWVALAADVVGQDALTLVFDVWFEIEGRYHLLRLTLLLEITGDRWLVSLLAWTAGQS